MSILEITIKLLLAVALGGLIGLERELSHKPAGFRTNILICMGSAMMMTLSGLILQGEGGTSGDMTRIAAGVVTGIGFIGAGAIIQARGIVLGLTTAATIWAVAGLGLVIGSGYFMIAIIFTSIIMLTLVLFRQIEKHFSSKKLYSYCLKTRALKNVLTHLKKIAIQERIKFSEIKHKKEGDLSLIYLSFTSSEETEQRFNQSILSLEEVIETKID